MGFLEDLVGKLDALNVECDKCGRRGRYLLAHPAGSLRFGLKCAASSNAKLATL